MSARTLAMLIAVSMGLLSGCAATVRTSEGTAPVRVGSHANSAIVLSITGSKTATESSDWEQFKGIWRQALKDEASSISATFDTQEGDPKAKGMPGTLLVVDVADFRLISAGARYGLGVMTGNAFVSARVTFRDLASGDVWGDRPYDTKSTAWQGVFSAMTEKQVRAICRDIAQTLRDGASTAKH